MLQVETTGAGPSMFSGARHQSFDHSDFRVSGRDMYNTPTVNVNITTPTSQTSISRARMDLVRAPAQQATTHAVQAQGGRGLWSRGFARFLRGRTEGRNPGHREELHNTAVAQPLVGIDSAAANNGRSVAGDSTGCDFAIVSYIEASLI